MHYKTETQRLKVVIDHFVDQGGEGEVYRAHNERTNETVAVKIFSGRLKNGDTLKRIRYLASLNLRNRSPVLFGPIDTISNGVIGHVSPWAEGISLEELLQAPMFSLYESLQLCQSLAAPDRILRCQWRRKIS